MKDWVAYRIPGADGNAAAQRALGAAGKCACSKYRIGMLECLPAPPAGERWPLSVPFRQWTENGVTRTQGVSTCGIFAMWVLSPWVEQWQHPYVVGSAFSEIRTRGVAVQEPSAGCIVLTPSHAMVVVEYVPEIDFLETVEGGQLCSHKQGEDGHDGRGLQAIRIKTHSWRV